MARRLGVFTSIRGTVGTIPVELIRSNNKLLFFNRDLYCYEAYNIKQLALYSFWQYIWFVGCMYIKQLPGNTAGEISTGFEMQNIKPFLFGAGLF